MRNDPSVPHSEKELTSEWLTHALKPNFPNLSILSVITEQIGEQFGLASSIYRCRLGGDQCPESLVVKLWSTSGPGGTREVEFYKRFQTSFGANTPHCHFGAICEETQRGVLILEDLVDVIQGDFLFPTNLADSANLAIELAKFHSTWWGRNELEKEDWLPSVRASSHSPEWFESRRSLFLERFGDRITPRVQELVERGEHLEAQANERLAHAPQTLVHGDFHLDNVIFKEETREPVILDWARVSLGPAALDLADLLFVNAAPSDLDRVFSIYYETLTEHGVREYSELALHSELEGALLRKFLQHTLGIARWEPQSERGTRLLNTGLQRMMSAVSQWRERNPNLFCIE